MGGAKGDLCIAAAFGKMMSIKDESHVGRMEGNGVFGSRLLYEVLLECVEYLIYSLLHSHASPMQ